MSVNDQLALRRASLASLQTRRIASHWSGAKRDARLVSNFFTSSGMPSARRRRWPIGYSTATCLRARAVFEKNLHGVGDGAFLRIEIVFRVLRIFDADHLGAQGIDARIARNRIFVVIGGELAEDQTDGGHILNAVVAVGGIVQRPGLIDDADRRFVGRDDDLVDLLDAILHLMVQVESRTRPRSAHEIRREKKF